MPRKHKRCDITITAPETCTLLMLLACAAYFACTPATTEGEKAKLHELPYKDRIKICGDYADYSNRTLISADEFKWVQSTNYMLTSEISGVCRMRSPYESGGISEDVLITPVSEDMSFNLLWLSSMLSDSRGTPLLNEGQLSKILKTYNIPTYNVSVFHTTGIPSIIPEATKVIAADTGAKIFSSSGFSSMEGVKVRSINNALEFVGTKWSPAPILPYIDPLDEEFTISRDLVCAPSDADKHTNLRFMLNRFADSIKLKFNGATLIEQIVLQSKLSSTQTAFDDEFLTCKQRTPHPHAVKYHHSQVSLMLQYLGIFPEKPDDVSDTDYIFDCLGNAAADILI